MKISQHTTAIYNGESGDARKVFRSVKHSFAGIVDEINTTLADIPEDIRPTVEKALGESYKQYVINGQAKGRKMLEAVNDAGQPVHTEADIKNFLESMTVEQCTGNTRVKLSPAQKFERMFNDDGVSDADRADMLKMLKAWDKESKSA